MLQTLPDLQRRFDIKVIPHVVASLQPQMYPAADLLAQYSAVDATRLASLYQLDFPREVPATAPGAAENASQVVSNLTGSAQFFHAAREIGASFWSGTDITDGARPGSGKTGLRRDEALLHELGHYASATLYYGGEWYWGLDRLDHLERRLLSLGLASDRNDSVQFDRTWRGLFKPTGVSPGRQELEYFFSARSPYSYLGFFHARRFAAAHKLELKLKPVLPMVMRGMAVPRAKRIYILTDAKREAEKTGLAFGNIVDPIGRGIERAYAVAHWASSTGALETFIASLLPAIAADAIDVANDRGLRKVVLRAGLDWQSASQALTSERWRDWVSGHRDEMTALGLWGVPCLKYGNTTAWGQDRFWVIRNAIAEGHIPA